MITLDFEKMAQTLEKTESVRQIGKVLKMYGFMIEGNGPDVPVGSMCEIHPKGAHKPIQAEVVGFKENSILLMPLGDPVGIGPGSTIMVIGEDATIKVSDKLLGRVLDGRGLPIDGLGNIEEGEERTLYAEPINPLQRESISEPVDLGIKSLNSLLTVGQGQRIGIMAGTGVGKSVLLGMMARNTKADVVVIGLIGERGKEVGDFIKKNLGEEGLKRSVVVAATSDQPPLIRLRGALIATTIAEYFRDQGKNVVLMMDSLTRFSMAQREIGLAIGEPPTTKGYPPSVFTLLPKLLERAGKGAGKEAGSITGLYTVLVEGDDLSDPISDASRAILDGHIVLSRNLAERNHYPAIDIMQSVSRVMIDVVSKEQTVAAGKVKEIIAVYRDAEDLINIGAYVKGSNSKIDIAINTVDSVNQFLKQDIHEQVDMSSSVNGLHAIASQLH